MTEEQIKVKAKEYFPNDEFKQQIVIDAINWATKELQKENADLKEEINKIAFARGTLEKENAELKGEADSVLDNWCRGNNPCPHLAKLEKENAELKLKLEALDGQTPWKDIKDKSEVIGKLNNAKRIIKDLLADNTDWTNKLEAEQFIEEINYD